MNYLSRCYIILAATSLLAASCKEPPAEERALITIPDDIVEFTSKTLFKDFVEEAEFIPLETTSESMIAEHSQLVVSPFGYTVLDKGQQAVKHFSKEGKYLFDIGKFGRGPGEYAGPVSVSYDNGSFFVLDQINIYQYDALTGKFIIKFPLSRYCVQAEVRGDIVYCLDVVHECDVIFATRLSDPEFIDVLYEGPKHRNLATEYKLFIPSGENILFCDKYLGKVYQLKDGKAILLVNYNFTGKQELEKSLKKGEKTRNLDIYSEFGHPCLVNDEVVFDFYTTGHKIDYRVCKINLEDHSLTELTHDLYIKQPIYYYYSYNQYSDNEYVYRLEPPLFTYLKEDVCIDSIPEHFSTFKRILHLTREDDNYYVVKTKLK